MMQNTNTVKTVNTVKTEIIQNSNFDNTPLIEDDKKSLLDGVTNMDLKCSTDLHNIGNNLVLLGMNITSFQTKMALVDKDKTISRDEKLKQKSLIVDNFINNNEIYNNVKTIVGKITALNFYQVQCIANKDTDYICNINTNVINFNSMNTALTKYKSLIDDMLRWMISLIDERQKYCGYSSINNAQMKQFYTNALSIVNPYNDYYYYLYSGMGFIIGITIGMIAMYFLLKKK